MVENGPTARVGSTFQGRARRKATSFTVVSWLENGGLNGCGPLGEMRTRYIPQASFSLNFPVILDVWAFQ